MLDGDTLKKVYDLRKEIAWGVEIDPPDSFNFRFSFFTDYYKKIVGIGHKEMAGKLLEDCLTPGDHIKIFEKYSECVIENSNHPFIYNEYLEIGGKPRWWRTSLSLVKDENDCAILILGSAIEVEAIESQLRNAIATNQLKVFYQPIIHINNSCNALLKDQSNIPHECISGLEALIRWPSSGYSPLQFIPVAEKAGLLPDITRIVLFDACRVINRMDNHIWVAVNVADCDFTSDMEKAIQRFKIKRNRLALEINETTNFTQKTIDRYQGLIFAGTPVKIDDFGTVRANLEWLNKLKNLSAIKLDLSFIRGVSQSKQKQAICKASIELAKSFDPPIKVIAEGIENNPDFLWCYEHGVDEFQGYLFMEPIQI